MRFGGWRIRSHYAHSISRMQLGIFHHIKHILHIVELPNCQIAELTNSSQYSAPRRVWGITMVPPTMFATANIS
jgi:hypothetical protein